MPDEIDRELLTFIRQNPSRKRSEIKEIFESRMEVSKNTLNSRLDRLIAQKLIIEGVFVTDRWKRLKIKSYILISTSYRGDKVYAEWKASDGDPTGQMTYQQTLVQNIRRVIKEGPYRDELFLESVEIVLGADFDIIVVLLSDDVYPIGDFVTGFLRVQRDVRNTKTITVWPSRTDIPAPRPDHEP